MRIALRSADGYVCEVPDAAQDGLPCRAGAVRMVVEDNLGAPMRSIYLCIACLQQNKGLRYAEDRWHDVVPREHG